MGGEGVESDRLVVLVLAAPAVARRSLSPTGARRGFYSISWGSIAAVLHFSSLTEKYVGVCVHILKHRNK
jgi:hypothetical protein